MKSKRVLTVLFMVFSIAFSFSQERTKKELRTDRKLEKANQIQVLIDSKEFTFIGRKAIPQGYSAVDLTTNDNFLEFTPTLIKSEMPFFGRGYSGIGYGGDKGLKFEGNPTEFSVMKGKRSFEIKAVVRGENDVFKIILSVFFEGSATLTINSNNRSSIYYYGEITTIENLK